MGLLAIVAAPFAVDLLVTTLRPHAMGFREAALWYVLFASAAAGFGLPPAALDGWDYGGQFFAGYIFENSLAADNLFVFVVIMSSFAVLREYQQRVLIFGIAGSLCLRAGLHRGRRRAAAALSFIFLPTGLILAWTAFRLLAQRDADPDVSNSSLVRATQAAAGHRPL